MSIQSQTTVHAFTLLGKMKNLETTHKISIPFVHNGFQLFVKFFPWGVYSFDKISACLFVGFADDVMLRSDETYNIDVKFLVFDPIKGDFIKRETVTTLIFDRIDIGFKNLFSTEIDSPYLEIEQLDFQVLIKFNQKK